MTLTPLNPTSVPPSPFYSQGVQASGTSALVFVSGQVGLDDEGQPLPDVGAQATRAIANVYAVLEEAGLSATDLVKVTIYLTDPADAGAFMQAAAGTLPEPPPATTLLFVAGLAAPGLRVEIEAVAAR